MVALRALAPNYLKTMVASQSLHLCQQQHVHSHPPGPATSPTASVKRRRPRHWQRGWWRALLLLLLLLPLAVHVDLLLPRPAAAVNPRRKEVPNATRLEAKGEPKSGTTFLEISVYAAAEVRLHIKGERPFGSSKQTPHSLWLPPPNVPGVNATRWLHAGWLVAAKDRSPCALAPCCPAFIGCGASRRLACVNAANSDGVPLCVWRL